jgi:dipeptidyl aminopeptidase/acylaminoacyl peptidase
MSILKFLTLFKILIIVINSIITINTSNNIPFTATDLQKMNKIGSPVLSPDGKYIVYSITKWNEKTGKVNSYLECKNLENNQIFTLTDPNLNWADSSPLFSKNFPKVIAFVSNRSGSNQIWLLPFPQNDSKFIEPTQLTNYEVDVDNVRWESNTFTFTAEVFTSCSDLKCTADKNKEIQSRGTNTWHVYDKLMLRHWDKYDEGKISHLFFFKVGPNKDPSNIFPEKKSIPIELLKGKDIETPVAPNGNVGQYDLSKDGLFIAFTANLKNRDEAWSTGWKIFFGSLNNVSEIIMGTENYKGRTQDPRFSPNGNMISFLYMNRENSESDSLHLRFYDISANTFQDLTEEFDRSVIEHSWVGDDHILFTAAEDGTEKLFSVSVGLGKATIVATQLENEPEISNGAPMFFKNGESTKIYFTRNSYMFPNDIWTAEFSQGVVKSPLQITSVNSNNISKFEIIKPTLFFFKGGYGDKVQGWIFKPTNFVEGKKYPLAFLIHGGPESPFLQSWSFRWNPQLWTNRGYAVLMINPHGSPGSGQKFTDAVINDWGGVPYQDLMQGLDYASENFPFFDKDNACALGASYGGFMVNWIQGQTDRFKCLVTHDGVFSTVSMFYATEELWFPMAEYCPIYKSGCKPWEPEARINYEKHSPEKFVADWKTPHLVIHSSKDYRIPMSEGLSVFTALQMKNIPSRFLHFTEENHWVLKAENSIKWYEEVLKWLDTYTNKK